MKCEKCGEAAKRCERKNSNTGNKRPVNVDKKNKIEIFLLIICSLITLIAFVAVLNLDI